MKSVALILLMFLCSAVWSYDKIILDTDLIYEEINADKWDQDLPMLLRDPILEFVAIWYTLLMVQRGVMEHRLEQNDELRKMMTAFSLPYSQVGELLQFGAMVNFTPEKVLQAFLDSPFHEPYIRRPDTHVGIGAIRSGPYYYLTLYTAEAE